MSFWVERGQICHFHSIFRGILVETDLRGNHFPNDRCEQVSLNLLSKQKTYTGGKSISHHRYYINKCWVAEIPWDLKAFDTKSDNLSSNIKYPMVAGDNQLLQPILCPHKSYGLIIPYPLPSSPQMNFHRVSPLL